VTRRIGASIAWGLAGLAITGATAWGALALFYLGPGSETARMAAAWTYGTMGLTAILALAFPRARRWALTASAALFILALIVWERATPSNDRDWQPEVAVLPYASFHGDLVTVHNIRNFGYRSETEFTPAYYDRTFDLRRLDRVDMLASYWMGPAVAHLFLSFGFGDDHLAISIEARQDRTRPYGTLPGFFRQYELVYVVADERDVIRVRTNYRKNPPEDVYLFQLMVPNDNARRVFLDYLRDMNKVRNHPRFYNTLTTNCTTMILAHSAVNPEHVPYSWKVLLSGYAPEYVYQSGRLDQTLPFEKLRQRARINVAAQAADQAPDFSRRIRAADAAGSGSH
jgi:Domain of unknown function (DUF4105)